MKPFIILLATILPLHTFAQDAEKVQALEQKVLLLERRIVQLESQMRYATQPAVTSDARKMKKAAEARVADDASKYKADEIARVEAMYSRASRTLQDPVSKATLDSIVLGYPHLNRAGCAQLYRAQYEAGAEKERLLLDCIARFAGCYYLDGAQVGPLAMFQLAQHYRMNGKQEEAAKISKRIRKEHREAVDHRGELLARQI